LGNNNTVTENISEGRKLRSLKPVIPEVAVKNIIKEKPSLSFSSFANLVSFFQDPGEELQFWVKFRTMLDYG
jgi:hypothetical protein